MTMNLQQNKSPVFAPEFRLTLRLALPLIIAEVGWMSMGVVDTIMVGRLPNSAIAIGMVVRMPMASSVHPTARRVSGRR